MCRRKKTKWKKIASKWIILSMSLTSLLYLCIISCKYCTLKRLSKYTTSFLGIISTWIIFFCSIYFNQTHDSIQFTTCMFLIFVVSACNLACKFILHLLAVSHSHIMSYNDIQSPTVTTKTTTFHINCTNSSAKIQGKPYRRT